MPDKKCSFEIWVGQHISATKILSATKSKTNKSQKVNFIKWGILTDKKILCKKKNWKPKQKNSKYEKIEKTILMNACFHKVYRLSFSASLCNVLAYIFCFLDLLSLSLWNLQKKCLHPKKIEKLLPQVLHGDCTKY
jgi:hypothetical protein